MGTWGTGPFENDDAADLVATLARKVHRVSRTDSDNYNEARAAVQFVLLAHGTDILGGIGLDVALKALVKMRENSEWLSGYRRPQQIAAALDKEIGKVLARMRACKWCRRASGEADLKGLATLARRARRAPVPKSTFGAVRRRLKVRISRMPRRRRKERPR